MTYDGQDPSAEARRIRDLEKKVHDLSAELSTLRERTVVSNQLTLDFTDDSHRFAPAQWIGWGSAVACMLGVVAAGAWTLNDRGLPPWQRLAFGYGLSVVALFGGIALRRYRWGVGSGLLAAGLGLFMFTTISGIGAPDSAIAVPPAFVIPSVLAVLAGGLTWAFVLRDHAAAAVVLLVSGAAAALELFRAPTVVTYGDALLIAALAALFGSGMRLLRDWVAVHWSAIVAAVLLAAAVGFAAPDTLPAGSLFATIGVFATASFLLLGGLIWADSQQNLRRWESIAFLAIVSAGWVAIFFAPQEIAVARAVALLAVGCAFFLSTLADWSVRGTSSRFGGALFTLTGLWMLSGAVETAPDRSWPWFVVAGTPLIAALAYVATRQKLLVFAGFVASILALYAITSGEVSVREIRIFEQQLQLDEVFFGGHIVALILAAIVFQHIRHNVGIPSLPSLVYAAFAALVILAACLSQLSQDPSLAFILAGIGLTVGIVGLIVATPALEAAGFVIFAAAHVVFILAAWTEDTAFHELENLPAYVGGFAVATFAGGILWEHYIRGALYKGTFLYGAMCALPGIALVSPGAWLAAQYAEIVPLHVTLACMGAVLMIMGRVSGLLMLRHGALLALGVAGGLTVQRLYAPSTELPVWPQAAFEVAAVALCGVLTERFLVYSAGNTTHRIVTWNTARWLLVLLSATITALALYEWIAEVYVTLAWVGLAAGLLLIGIIFRELRYRIAALAVYLGPVVLHVFFYDLAGYSPLLRFLGVVGLLAPAAAISWGYAEWRARHPDSREARPKRPPRIAHEARE